MPTLMFANTNLLLKGTTAHAINASVRVTMGARTNMTLLALAGIIISLKMYFKASAKVC